MGGKWLGVLKEIAPNVKRVGALFATDAAPHGPFFRAAEKIAPSLGVTLAVVDIQKGFEGAIAAFADQPENGLMAFPHPKTMRAVSWSAHWRHAIGRQRSIPIDILPARAAWSPLRTRPT
jgi:hypothetical protein